MVIRFPRKLNAVFTNSRYKRIGDRCQKVGVVCGAVIFSYHFLFDNDIQPKLKEENSFYTCGILYKNVLGSPFQYILFHPRFHLHFDGLTNTEFLFEQKNLLIHLQLKDPIKPTLFVKPYWLATPMKFLSS